jgi:hypothetical protein
MHSQVTGFLLKIKFHLLQVSEMGNTFSTAAANSKIPKNGPESSALCQNTTIIKLFS